MQTRPFAVAAVLLGAGLVLPPPAAQDVPYRVVVHARNPVTRLTRNQVSQIFLRRVSLWDDRQPVLPVEPPPDAPVRRSFTKQVHRRTVASVQTYWQQETFAGRAVAPPERPSDADVLAYVRRYPTAIGYIHADTPLGDSLKVVIVSP